MAEAATHQAAAPSTDAKPADRPLYRERRTPIYARTISLPAEVDQQASQAKFENGVLTLVLAKKVATGVPTRSPEPGLAAWPGSAQAAASGQRGRTLNA